MVWAQHIIFNLLSFYAVCIFPVISHRFQQMTAQASEVESEDHQAIRSVLRSSVAALAALALAHAHGGSVLSPLMVSTAH